MRKTVYSILTGVSALVLLLSFDASRSPGTSGPPPVAVSAPRSPVSPLPQGSTSPTSGGPSGSDSATTAAGSGSTPSGGLTPGTYTGEQVDTPYGPLQVQVVVTTGGITSSDAPVHPTGNGHDLQVNSRAIPILNSEVVEAQSARITMVSGATFTSEGYLTSLQSALDQAKP